MKKALEIVGVAVVVMLLMFGANALLSRNKSLGGYAPNYWCFVNAGSMVQPCNTTLLVGANLFETGNIILGGMLGITTYRASTTLTTTQFCGVGLMVIMDSTSTATSTINLPSLASIQSSTPQTGGCGTLPIGGMELQRVYNSSTANLIVNASSGIVFKNASTSAWYSNNIPVGSQTSSSVVIPPGGTMGQDGLEMNTSTFFIIYNTLWL